MSRKRKAPVRKIYPDPKYRSVVISKFINSIMYDGKRSTAEKILYDALDKIKQKGKEKDEDDENLERDTAIKEEWLVLIDPRLQI